jgi:recombinational DNA repair protein RecR
MKGVEKLKDLFSKILKSRDVKGKNIEILEEKLNFTIAVNISITNLEELKNILISYRQIEIILKDDYESEIDLYSPYLELYLDKIENK